VHAKIFGIAQGKMVEGNTANFVMHLLGKSKWEKPLADWLMAKDVNMVGQEMRHTEAERVKRNDTWRQEPFL
jgi:hypothetical protein